MFIYTYICIYKTYNLQLDLHFLIQYCYIEAAVHRCSIEVLRWNVSQNSETVVWRCYVKKVFLQISQNLQKSACARVLF